MGIGFHLDDVDEAYFKSKSSDFDSVPPIGAPIHDINHEVLLDELPPISAPYHD